MNQLLTVVAVRLCARCSLRLGLAVCACDGGYGCGPGRREPGRVTPGEARNAVICLVNKQRNKAGLGKLDRDNGCSAPRSATPSGWTAAAASTTPAAARATSAAGSRASATWGAA